VDYKPKGNSLSQKEKAGRGCLPAAIIAVFPLLHFLDVGCLGAFWSLDDLELDGISFLQSAIAVPNDSGIMYEDIWSILAPDEAVTL
jgi:hypothetical protein